MSRIKSAGRYTPPTPQTRWVGIIFFIVIHTVGFIGTPVYLAYFGATQAEWTLFAVYTACTSMAITVGYHRYFAHASFKTGAIIRFLLLYFGAATFEQSALKWASQHRQHHSFTDTDLDPYNIQRGFWYAHFGWILFWKHRVNYDNVPDLMKSRLVLSQHHGYTLWSVGSGVAVPMLIGFWIGRPLGAFILSVCLRMALVMNSAFFINSFCHLFGSKTGQGGHSAGDHWLGAILTNGEGYHNYHHRFPGDYRNGILWHHWDPSKWFIYTLSRLGLAWDLKKAQI